MPCLLSLHLPHLAKPAFPDGIEHIKHLLRHFNALRGRGRKDCALLTCKGHLVHLEEVVALPTV
jgi:hypothetical protein